MLKHLVPNVPGYLRSLRVVVPLGEDPYICLVDLSEMLRLSRDTSTDGWDTPASNAMLIPVMLITIKLVTKYYNIVSRVPYKL